MVLRHLVAREREAIPAARCAFELPFSNQTSEHVRVDPTHLCFVRANKAAAGDCIENSLRVCPLLHVAYCIQLLISVNVLPHWSP